MAKKAPRKGQFGHSSRKSSAAPRRPTTSSTAMVRAAPAQIIRVTAPRALTKAKPKKGKRRHGGGGASTSLMGTLKSKAKHLGGSVGYGWITSGTGDTAKTIRDTLAKVPTLDAIGKPASHGLLATFIATRTKGMVRDVFDSLGTAALHRAAYNLGASDFSLEKAAALAGDDEMAGDMDDDEAGDDDEDGD